MKKVFVFLIYALFVFFVLFYLAPKFNIDNQPYISFLVILLFLIGYVIGRTFRNIK